MFCIFWCESGIFATKVGAKQVILLKRIHNITRCNKLRQELKITNLLESITEEFMVYSSDLDEKLRPMLCEHSFGEWLDVRIAK